MNTSEIIVKIIIIVGITILFSMFYFDNMPINCGICGAHVHDYWYVSNDSQTELIKVCEPCYLEVRETIN